MFQQLKKYVLIVLLLSLAVSVWAAPKTEREYKDEIQRINSLNPQQQAEQDIAQHKLQLYVFYDRGGMHIPGLSEQDERRLRASCQQLAMEGVGDVIYSDAHLEFYRVFMRYAASYNWVMRKLCIDPNKPLAPPLLLLPEDGD